MTTIDFSVGDRVYIPKSVSAPGSAQGLAGAVVAVRGDDIFISDRGSEPVRVSRKFVHHDRRRQLSTASWE